MSPSTASRTAEAVKRCSFILRSAACIQQAETFLQHMIDFEQIDPANQTEKDEFLNGLTLGEVGVEAMRSGARKPAVSGAFAPTVGWMGALLSSQTGEVQFISLPHMLI